MAQNKKATAMVTFIESLDAPGVEAYTRLTEAQLRNRLEPEQGIFIAESEKVIRVAIEAGLRPLSFLTEIRHLAQAQSLAALCSEETPIYTGDEALLAQLTGYKLSRGILCAMRRPAPITCEEACTRASRVAVIDSVVNATNTGAIFRAAAALGFDAVLLSPTCCDPLNRRSVRVSMGTVFQIPWAYIVQKAGEWPETAMHKLSEQGFATAAMALSNKSIPIDDPKPRSEPKLAVLLGSEGDGLDEKTLQLCDYVVRIPMQRNVDSLNVAAAAAIAFWQLRK